MSTKSLWISVEEKLPEETNTYIITFKPFEKSKNKVNVKTCIFENGKGWHENREVVCWMKLPLPPKKYQLF